MSALWLLEGLQALQLPLPPLHLRGVAAAPVAVWLQHINNIIISSILFLMGQVAGTPNTLRSAEPIETQLWTGSCSSMVTRVMMRSQIWKDFWCKNQELTPNISITVVIIW
jgi:hypothetical protein